MKQWKQKWKREAIFFWNLNSNRPYSPAQKHSALVTKDEWPVLMLRMTKERFKADQFSYK